MCKLKYKVLLVYSLIAVLGYSNSLYCFEQLPKIGIIGFDVRNDTLGTTLDIVSSGIDHFSTKGRLLQQNANNFIISHLETTYEIRELLIAHITAEFSQEGVYEVIERPLTDQVYTDKKLNINDTHSSIAIREVGKNLDVDYILWGSFQSVDDRAFCALRVYDVRDGEIIALSNYHSEKQSDIDRLAKILVNELIKNVELRADRLQEKALSFLDYGIRNKSAVALNSSLEVFKKLISKYPMYRESKSTYLSIAKIYMVQEKEDYAIAHIKGMENEIMSKNEKEEFLYLMGECYYRLFYKDLNGRFIQSPHDGIQLLAKNQHYDNLEMARFYMSSLLEYVPNSKYGELVKVRLGEL